MPENLFAEPSLIEDIDWSELIKDINKKRCVLFLGPTLPLFSEGAEKIDFYTKAALHLSTLLASKEIPFDPDQKGNLQYIARRFLALKKNVRIRLDDEIGPLYAAEIERVKREGDSALPEIYKNIAKLPWDSIVNTQPDQFLEYAFKRKINFHYYHYKSLLRTAIDELNSDSLLVYNFFGTFIKEDDDYTLESLVLTEEDQVDFVRNVIKDKPPIPENVISRFDESKRYIFLDFNLENWHFRLLLEALKLKKDFYPISPQHLKINFSFYTKDFYKNRYGFLFVKNNSEEFIQELVEKYYEKYPAEPGLNLKHQKIFIVYHDDDENSAALLIRQLDPWVKKGAMDIWFKAERPAGERVEQETEAFNAADCIILMISADLLNSPLYNRYIIPALEKAAKRGATKVIAVIARECVWRETGVIQLNYILPQDGKALSTGNGQNMDEKFKQTAIAISGILW